MSNTTGGVPHPYAVIQVCAEGCIASDKLEKDLGKGSRPNGDLIPYTLSQHFQESSFAELSGMRVVRIAVAPDLARQKYGTRAMQLLIKYYNGEMCPLREEGEADPEEAARGDDEDLTDTANFTLRPRTDLPHLLHRLSDRPPERCHYLGVSYGLSVELFTFWFKQCGFQPVYLRQVCYLSPPPASFNLSHPQGKNDLTGEHSVTMLRTLNFGDRHAQTWVDKYCGDFTKRFIRLLPLAFRGVSVVTALSVAQDPNRIKTEVVAEAGSVCKVRGVSQLTEAELMHELTPWDLQRISAFTRQLVDRSVILDLIPVLASMYFSGRMHRRPDGKQGVTLPVVQAAVLLGIGLQGITVDDIMKQPEFMSQKAHQLHSSLDKAVSRIAQHFDALRSQDAAEEVDESEGALPKTTTTADDKIKAIASFPKGKKRLAEDKAKAEAKAKAELEADQAAGASQPTKKRKKGGKK